MDNYTILIWSPQASLVTELQDSNDLLYSLFAVGEIYWCVSVLTGHVQQHYWHYIVGKFHRYITNCFYTLIYTYTVVLPHPQHLGIDSSLHSVYDVRWHFSLSLHSDSLVISCVADLKWGTQHKSDLFSLHAEVSTSTYFSSSHQLGNMLLTLVVAINLVTCSSFLNNPWIADVSYLRCARVCAKCGCRIFVPN